MNHRRPLRVRGALAASLVALLPQIASAEVFVVDDDFGPGVDFADVQSAVNAAFEGDQILVRAGQYSGFFVVGKSLSVLAEEAGAVSLDSGVSIRVLGPDQEVNLRGFDVAGDGGEALLLQDVAGLAWLEACRFVGAPGAGLFSEPGGPDGSPAMRADNARATFQRCELIAGQGTDLGVGLGLQGNGGAGARIENGAAVSFYDCQIRAGRGGHVDTDEAALDGGDGGHAVLFRSGTLVLSGCELTAGDGGLGGTDPDALSGPLCGGGGDAGSAVAHGVFLTGPAEAYALDTTLQPGAPGLGGSGCGDGAAGLEVDLPNGSLALQPGSAASLQLNSPVDLDATVTVAVEGAPGAPAALLVNSGSEWLYESAVFGSFHVDLSAVAILNLGVLPADGQLSFDVAAPSSVLQVRAQVVHVPGGGAILGAASELTVLALP